MGCAIQTVMRLSRPRRHVINMCHSWCELVQRLGQARSLLICGGVGKTIREEPGHTVAGVSLPQLSFGERLAPASVCSCDRFSPISRCSLTKNRPSPQAPCQGLASVLTCSFPRSSSPAKGLSSRQYAQGEKSRTCTWKACVQYKANHVVSSNRRCWASDTS